MNNNPFYVPIVKWKQGEQGALKELTEHTKDSIIPLLEITPDINESKFISTLNNWPSRHFYFDMVPECYNEDEYMYFRMLRECDPNLVIPVLCLNDGSEPIKAAFDFSKSGIAFRISSNDADSLEDSLNEITKVYKPNNIDLILDMKEVTTENYNEKNIVLKSLLSDIPNIHLFRRIILSGNSFPSSLTGIDKYNYSFIDRQEYLLWQRSNKLNSKYEINIIYSDYCINHHSFLEYIPGMSPSFNIRYTTDKSFLILKGDTIKKGGLDSENVIDLCEKIIDSGYFKGENFSWGDHYIFTRCNDAESYGNLSTWRKVGTNHHIELVVNQLSTLL